MKPKPPSYELHSSKTEAAYDFSKIDMVQSKATNSDTLVIAMDLQQALPTPYLSTKSVFCQRELWT
jgi:hypothetical protein